MHLYEDWILYTIEEKNGGMMGIARAREGVASDPVYH